VFLHAPGEQQSYSGEAFDYLRKAVEAKFGKPFQQIAAERLFTPAGMACAAFDGPKPGCGQYVHKYHHHYRFDPPDWAEADIKGGLTMTVSDMEKLLRWVLAGAGLREETWALISEPNPASLVSAEEGASRERFGLGWVVSQRDGLVLAHGGSEFGARTYIVLLPRLQSGVMIATNASGGMPAIRMILEATLKQQHPLSELERDLARSESFDW
jgi:CubicO group peptidase (beta-lactamase class C family)